MIDTTQQDAQQQKTDPSIWGFCLKQLSEQIDDSDFITWIKPIQADLNDHLLHLFFQNIHVLRRVQRDYLPLIEKCINQLPVEKRPVIRLSMMPIQQPQSTVNSSVKPDIQLASQSVYQPTHLNGSFTIENFVEGKSNELARAGVIQVAKNPGTSYNPLVIYGDVGLGKTHLMQAAGNIYHQKNPHQPVEYVHSERFVSRMVSALQRNEMERFKQHFRSLKILMIDDIQFLMRKERSQEELFHTFNHLLDNGSQIILTTDRYPRELDGIEDRLKSRFSWGLTVGIESPELETRVAILIRKAELSNVTLPEKVAFFIAQNVTSNVRELEGALKRVIANAHFMGRMITIDFVKEALKDLLTLNSRTVSIDVIQKAVARYYKMKSTDLVGKRRNRSIARPRQIAMTLAKRLTTKSLPEIGEAFGGRDHTTVLHAVKTIEGFLENSPEIKEDYENLVRILST